MTPLILRGVGTQEAQRLCCIRQRKSRAPYRGRGPVMLTQRYNDVNPTLLWRGRPHYL
jgi:hypothetical protein